MSLAIAFLSALLAASAVRPVLDGKVVVLGDSLTAGEGVPAASSFVGLLRVRHPKAEILAQGRSGWSTGAYVRRMAEVLKAVPQDANVIIVLLGTNDLRERGHSDETVASTTDNMATLLNRLRAHAPGAEQVLVSPPLVHPQFLVPRLREAGFGAQTPTYILKLRDAYERLARRRGLVFIDLSAALRPPETLDGAHPTAAGHAAIARALQHGLATQRPNHLP